MILRQLVPLAGLLSVFMVSDAARAQNLNRNDPDSEDVVQRWSADVLDLVEHTAERVTAVHEQPEHLSEAGYSVLFHLAPVGMLPPEKGIGARSQFSLAFPPLPKAINSSYGRLFVPLMRDILRGRGLPEQLIAVSLVESGFNPVARAPKGARGLWQLMPETALRFGLKTDGPLDERLDPVRSTRAAAQYLEELYREFGDWALALAAYNSGEARVRLALSAEHVRDFWELSRLKLLPEETLRYVPAVFSAADRFLGRRSLGGWE